MPIRDVVNLRGWVARHNQIGVNNGSHTLWWIRMPSGHLVITEQPILTKLPYGDTWCTDRAPGTLVGAFLSGRHFSVCPCNTSAGFLWCYWPHKRLGDRGHGTPAPSPPAWPRRWCCSHRLGSRGWSRSHWSTPSPTWSADCSRPSRSR